MGNYSLIFIILLFLKIHHVCCSDSDFTKIGKMQMRGYPFKFKDKLHFISNNFGGSTSIFTTERVDGECPLRDLEVGLSSISVLGNGKLLVNDKYFTHFNVIDFRRCSHPVVTLVSHGENYRDVYLRGNYGDALGSLVAYNDTFDVYDKYQRSCTPCRYNDKGERLEVEYSLPEDLKSWENDGFSLERVEDAFGVKDGYFYVFKYRNETTVLRILDSKFKVVRQRIFNTKIEAHSLTKENLTVCYKVNPCWREPPDASKCPPGFSFCHFAFAYTFQQSYCYRVECQLLDSNLNTTANVKLHQISADPNQIHVQMSVQNLVGGGAMVAMQFQFDRSQAVHHKEIFLQRIHPNGRVDRPILFDSLENDFVTMYDFVFDNGEYCLVTINDYYSQGTHTLVKCLNPSPADYSVLPVETTTEAVKPKCIQIGYECIYL